MQLLPLAGLLILRFAGKRSVALYALVITSIEMLLAIAGLFFMTGLIFQRTGTTRLDQLGGLFDHMPVVAIAFLVAGLAALAAVILGASYFISLYRKAFLGPVTNSAVKQAVDLQGREFFIIGTSAVLILAAGFYPAVVLDLIDVSAQDWIKHLK